MSKHYHKKLDNGMNVLIFSNKKSKIITFNMSLKVGSDIEEEKTLEVGHFLEHLFSLYTSSKYPDGKKNREFLSMNNIDEEAEITSKNILFSLEFKKKFVDYIIDLVSHSLFDFKCDTKMFVQEKNSVIEELNAIINESNYKLETKIDSVIFKNHSRSISQDKRLQNCLKLKPKDIEAFYKKYFVPENIVLGFFGNLEATPLFNKIKKVFNKNSITNIPIVYPCYRYKHNPKDQIIYLKKNTNASNLRIYYRIPYTFFDKEYYTIYAILKILSSDLNSILFRKLRAEKGLIYDIDADMELDKKDNDLSLIEVTTSMDTSNLLKVLKIILDILNKTKTEIPAEYILKYKDSVKIDQLHYEFCQNPKKLLSEYTDYILWDKPIIPIQQEFKNFANINSLKLKKICQVIFNTKNIHICYDGKINYNTQIRQLINKF